MKINRRCALFVLTTGFALMIWAVAGIDLSAQAGEAWCPTFQRLRAASTADDNFQSVKGDPDPTGTLSWLGRVTFPRGLTDCWMDQYPGVRRTIYACATETMTQAEAV